MYDDDDAWDDADETYDDDDEDDFGGEYDDEFEAHYRCPACGAEVYEDANLCPACGDYIVPVLMAGADLKPIWFIALGMIGIIAVLLALSGLF